MAEIVCYIYIFHLTWPLSLHYLVTNTRFITIRLLRFGVKVQGRTVTTTFLLRGHCNICALRRLSQDEFFVCVSTGQRPFAYRTKHCRFSWARETQETRRRLSSRRLCPCTRGAHFEHELWQFWADLPWQLITLLNKPLFQFTVCLLSRQIVCCK